MHRLLTILLLLAASTFTMSAQSVPTTQPSEPSTEDQGFLSYVDFGGSRNGDGRLFTLGLSAGYQFNRHIIVSARLPIYFVSATSTTTTGSSTTLSNKGVGDPALAVQLNFPNHVLDYQTRVTTWIPVASTTNGLSTSFALVDWTNRISRRIGRVTPFGQLDIANTVPDTPLFILPYTAQGVNARFEGGANVGLTKILSAGASIYDVLPMGQQNVYSRLVTEGSTSGIGGSTGSGSESGFMTNSYTQGSGLTRDHGFSTWVVANLRHFDMELGYTRSYGYNLNTVSFGIGFDPLKALHDGRR